MIQLKGRYVMPHWKDPRWTLLAFLLTYAIMAINSPTFTRTPAQFFAAVGTCIGLDFFLITFYKRIKLVPLSGFIAAMGTFLLTDSPEVWPYFLVASLSILSKHFIVMNGRHIFNPNNFGVVVAVLFCAEQVMSEPGRWGGNAVSATLISMFGLFCVYRANKLVLSLTYTGVFFLGVLLRAEIFNANVMRVMAPMTGAGFHLFIFYMISDPATTPSNKKHQFIFALLLATLDTYLRYKQMKYAPFFSLFIMCALYSAVRAPRKEVPAPMLGRQLAS